MERKYERVFIGYTPGDDDRPVIVQCFDCGSIVLNREVHDRWHDTSHGDSVVFIGDRTKNTTRINAAHVVVLDVRRVDLSVTSPTESFALWAVTTERNVDGINVHRCLGQWKTIQEALDARDEILRALAWT